jgi:hypothetical protein
MTAAIPKYRLFLVDNFFSLFGAGFVLLFDVVFDGSYLFSGLICPIWFIVSLIRNLIARTEWHLALFRLAIPVFTLGIAVTNSFIQSEIADANSERIITACEAFHTANGHYPKTLDELAPKYLPSVPPAKYCMDGGFHYFNSDGPPPILWWNEFGFLHKIYSFERKEWNYLD